jgi:hypothetical protein
MSNTLSGNDREWHKKTDFLSFEIGERFYMPFKMPIPKGLDEQQHEYKELYVEHIMKRPIYFKDGNLIIAQASVDCVGQERVYLTCTAVNKEYKT